jgi:hypothetical protein
LQDFILISLDLLENMKSNEGASKAYWKLGWHSCEDQFKRQNKFGPFFFLCIIFILIFNFISSFGKLGAQDP